MFKVNDHKYMTRALRLAERGLYTTRPNPRVGCVIVKDAHVVGEGFHAIAGGPHAEVAALKQAGDLANGAAVYVTLEPCCHFGRTPPCVDALIAARVAHVIYAIGDPNPNVAGGGAARLSAAGIAHHSGLMADAARELNRGFFTRHTKGRPWVRVKIGMSLDGKVALANGQSQWITSDDSRRDVQRLRAEAGAIVTGIGTVLADDPALTVRDPRFDVGGRPPPRIILDSTLRLPPQSRLLANAGEIIVYTAVEDEAQLEKWRARGVVIEQVPAANGMLELTTVLTRLAAREINDVLVEAGTGLVSNLMRHQLIDELVLYIAPKILGDSARGAFALPPLQVLTEASQWRVIESRQNGQDQRLTLRPMST